MFQRRLKTPFTLNKTWHNQIKKYWEKKTRLFLSQFWASTVTMPAWSGSGRVPSGCTLPPAPSVFLASCLTYSYEDTYSFHGGCTFKIWLLPKGPPSNVITLRLRFQHMNFGKRGAQTFNPLLRAIRFLEASVRKAGEIPSWSLSSIWKTGCELGLNPAQEWGNCC